jgi:hypothetical protein
MKFKVGLSTEREAAGGIKIFAPPAADHLQVHCETERRLNQVPPSLRSSLRAFGAAKYIMALSRIGAIAALVRNALSL